MSQAAGAPSERLECSRPSPDVRPSELDWGQLFSSASCSSLPERGGHMRRHCTSPRERPPEFAHNKHEAQYAMNLFGAQPEIDFTIKRGSGAYSPRQGGPPRDGVGGGAGSRSAFSDQCEAAQTLRFWGASPYIEVVGRRGMGSCSPRSEGREVEASCGRRHQYLQDCVRSGLSDISEVHRLGAGECSPRSPRRDSDMGSLSSNESPTANLISKEVYLASGLKKMGARAGTSPPRTTAFDLDMSGSTGHSSTPSRGTPGSPERQRSPGSRSRRLLEEATLRLQREGEVEVPSWALPTSSSRSRNAQDLSSVKTMLQDKLLQSPRSSDVSSVRSGSGVGTSRCTHSCRLGDESSTVPSRASSPRRASTRASSSSRCTHSCRVGSVSQRSTASGASTTSSPYPLSHKSFRMAGDILTELKASKTLSKTPRPAHSLSDVLSVQAGCSAGLPTSTQGPKLAGHILADLRASQTRSLRRKGSSPSSFDLDFLRIPELDL